eukprot:961074-Pleurochrysis_carterae.AAC.1
MPSRLTCIRVPLWAFDLAHESAHVCIHERACWRAHCCALGCTHACMRFAPTGCTLGSTTTCMRACDGDGKNRFGRQWARGLTCKGARAEYAQRFAHRARARAHERVHASMCRRCGEQVEARGGRRVWRATVHTQICARSCTRVRRSRQWRRARERPQARARIGKVESGRAMLGTQPCARACVRVRVRVRVRAREHARGRTSRRE